MTTEGATNPMRATPNGTRVSRSTNSRTGLPSAFVQRANDGPGAGASALVPTNGTQDVDTAPGGSTAEPSRGPQLSEQLDMLAELFASRRQADLERRGLFLHPEVF
jgi:hypothetical protein